MIFSKKPSTFSPFKKNGVPKIPLLDGSNLINNQVQEYNDILKKPSTFPPFKKNNVPKIPLLDGLIDKSERYKTEKPDN